MSKIELKVNYDDFCNWYFDDSLWSDMAIEKLIKKGVVSIQCIADEVEYLPLELVQNPEVIRDEDLDGEAVHEIALQERFKVTLLRE